MKTKSTFKRVDKETDRKLRYEGFCNKCNKVRPYRFYGSSTSKNIFRCMSCNTKNVGEFE